MPTTKYDMTDCGRARNNNNANVNCIEKNAKMNVANNWLRQKKNIIKRKLSCQRMLYMTRVGE